MGPTKAKPSASEAQAQHALLDTLEESVEWYAHTPCSARLRAVVLAWEQAAAQLPRTARLQLLARVAARVERAALAGRALLPIVLGDADGCVVAAAVTSLAAAHQPDAADPEPGPFYVLKHALTSEPGNLGAVLGALLGLGDAAVGRWIFELRHLLAHPRLGMAVAEMSRCHTGVVRRATVDFYLDWLDELVEHLPASAETFGRVANGLVGLRTSTLSDHHADGCPHHRSLVEHHRNGDGSSAIPLRELTRSIWPRLVALEQIVRPSEAMRAVLAAWGRGSPEAR